MYALSSVSVIVALAVQAVLGLPGIGNSEQFGKRDVASFVSTEQPIALNGILCNIGSTGSCVSGAASGLVIASPSTSNPDCEFAVPPYPQPPQKLLT